MKVRIFLLSVLSLLTLSSITPSVQASWCPEYYYISGLGAATWQRDMKLKATSTVGNPVQTIDTDYDIGYGAAGAIGVGVAQCWRFEIEGYYRENKGDKLIYSDPSQITTISTNFRYRSFSLMANIYRDFCVCDCLQFYVGGGLGAAWVEFFTDNFTIAASSTPGGCPNPCRGPTDPPCPAPPPVPPNACCPTPAGCTCPCFVPDPMYDLDDIRFAYQIMAGFAYPIMCNVEALIGYRLWGTLKEKNHPNNGAKLSEWKFLMVQSLEAGLRLRF